MRATPKAGTAVSRCADTASRPAAGRSPVGAVAFGDRKIKAGWIDAPCRPIPSWVASPVGVRRFPRSGRGDVVAVRWYLRGLALDVPEATRPVAAFTELAGAI
jgi:hypothetical protein